ncbi:DNA-binding transcriptional activator of the SARP family [Marinactinospora thermotolerans DSM 45154]|uniref:DNA-binding transcriptional activator of the SARP family n=3 Tax=Marinactinospora thermotolerans TaxID=531310 RepID=A0A1T4SLI6_9ACTN|nr:SARP [Marinactinospora thermotolerans]SKA29045.1 DNA-binding transcriptional activator of the SARP family [Marinactinospora thermotolerans DSM 45154]
MAHRLEFRVLGPLDVTSQSGPVRIPAGKQRVLLSALLLAPNTVVSLEELVGLLWDDVRPDSPRAALHTCLTRLRATLDSRGAGPSGLIRTTAAGYLIEVGPEELDLLRFRAHSGAAHAAAKRGDQAAERMALDRAVELWRGPMLPDVRSASLHRDVVPRITEEWLRVRERRHEISMAGGCYDELVGELRELVRRYPFHERFWYQLIVCLCRCGRRVEALEAFGEISGRLREEMGMDPGRQLRDLHLSILRGEPD